MQAQNEVPDPPRRTPQLGLKPSVDVRRAVPNDARSISVVHVNAWRIGYRGLVPADALERLSVPAREGMWRESLVEREHPQLLRQVDVAVLGTSIIGFVAAGTAPPHRLDLRWGQVYALFVDPTHWSEGVGGALLEAATIRLAGIGLRRGSLWMIKGNSRAQRFYESHGWILTGQSRMMEMEGLPDFDLPLVEVCLERNL